MPWLRRILTARPRSAPAGSARRLPRLAAALLLLPACGHGAEANSGFRGAELPVPKPKPAFSLIATDGQPYPFRQRTDGYLTFLFFGYTHCPDVCPVQMSNLASALHRLDPAVQERVRVVFVTTDPARDSSDVLRRWLDRFDRRFIGLTGTDSQIARAEATVGLMPSVKLDSGSAYTVGHAAQVMVYTPDDQGHVVYLAGSRAGDFAADIPRLLRRWPGGGKVPGE